MLQKQNKNLDDVIASRKEDQQKILETIAGETKARKDLEEKLLNQRRQVCATHGSPPSTLLGSPPST